MGLIGRGSHFGALSEEDDNRQTEPLQKINGINDKTPDLD
jgi:hypothetical protein